MRRKQIITAIIVILVLFNLYQWLPNTGTSKNSSLGHISASDLKLNGVFDRDRKIFTRNLFYTEKVIEKKGLKALSNSATDNVTEHGVIGVAGIKLIGVIFKSKHYEAFLTMGDARFKVRVNKFVTPRYKVKRITFKSIKLKDVRTGKMHKIILSDG